MTIFEETIQLFVSGITVTMLKKVSFVSLLLLIVSDLPLYYVY